MKEKIKNKKNNFANRIDFNNNKKYNILFSYFRHTNFEISNSINKKNKIIPLNNLF